MQVNIFSSEQIYKKSYINNNNKNDEVQNLFDNPITTNNVFNNVTEQMEYIEAQKEYINTCDKTTKDGKIGNTKQGNTGDCWLLSGINALSYTEKGREIIKNALEYHQDEGYTVVHTYAGDYVVYDEEIEASKKETETFEDGKTYTKFATGDDDMIILEIAIEKIYEDVANGKIDIPFVGAKLPENKDKLSGEYDSSSIMYLLTGHCGEIIEGQNNSLVSCKDIVYSWLEEFGNNQGKDIAITLSIEQNKMLGSRFSIEDINGQEHKMSRHHEYAIKKVDNENGTVTIINPWDSSDEITITKEQFINTFTRIEKYDLSSDTNSLENYIDLPELQDAKAATLQSFARLTKEEKDFALKMMRKNPNIDKYIIILYTNKKNPTVDNLKAYLNGSDSDVINQLLPNSLKSSFLNPWKKDFKKCLKRIEELSNDEEKNAAYQRIIDRHLINNPDIVRELNGDDVYFLSLIPDDKWDKAMEYLKNNQKMSGEDIYKLLS